MDALVLSSQTQTNWVDLFKTLEQQGGVPAATDTDIAANRAIFRAMVLDLAEVKKQITDAVVGEPTQVVLYADVVTIPEALIWTARDAALLIYARRVESAPTARIFLDLQTESKSACFMLYTNELAGNVTVIAAITDETGSPNGVPFIISAPPADGGVLIRRTGGAPALSPVTKAQGLAMTPTVEFVDAMKNEFIFASLLYDQEPEIALAMLTWTKEWSAVSGDLVDLFLRSCPLVALLSAQINAASNGAVFVPYLTSQVYTTLANAYVAEAQKYEADYRALSIESVVNTNFINLAQTLLDNQVYQSQYVDGLLAQAKTNYDYAVAAANAAQVSFDKANRNAQLVKIDFEEVGIPEWERQQIAKAIIGLVTAAITFGVGIASMALGNPAGAAGAGAAVEGATAIMNAAEAGSSIATMASQLAEVMDTLKDLIEALEKIYEFSKAVVIAAQDLANADAMVDQLNQMDVATGGSDLSATYEWQIYQLRADATLETPIELGVRYSTELKLAIDEVAIYGQALAAAQLGVITASQEYAKVRMQKDLAVKQQKRLQEYLDQLVTGQAPVAALMQEIYQRYIDAKSSLFSALQGYRASFFYWALRPSSIQPRIIDDVDTLDAGLKDLTAIALDEANALNNFSPPPQIMRQKQVVITDPVVLARLKDSGATSFTITLDNSVFAALSRTRLSRVRVWLESTRPVSADAVVKLSIATPGAYLDRLRDSNFQFTSKPLQRGFQYRVARSSQGQEDWRFEDGTYGYVEIDGVVDDEVSYAYFVPTPFAEWYIAGQRNVVQDFSGVTRIILDFAGSVIAPG